MSTYPKNTPVYVQYIYCIPKDQVSLTHPSQPPTNSNAVVNANPANAPFGSSSFLNVDQGVYDARSAAKIDETMNYPTGDPLPRRGVMRNSMSTGLFSPCCCYILAGIMSILALAIIAGLITGAILIANSQITTSSTTITSTNSASVTSGPTTITTSTASTTTTSDTTTSTTTPTTTTTTVTTTVPPCTGWSWNTTGVTVAGTGSVGNSANQLALPWNVFLDSNNTMYIADSDNSRVVKWLAGASIGTTIAGTGVNGTGATQLSEPRAVFLQGNTLYVADGVNNRVQMFINGSLTAVTAAISGLGNVFWVELDSAGNIYTPDATNNVVRKNQTVLISGNGLYGPQGTSVMSNGTIYIVNTLAHTILQWSPGQSTPTIVAGVNGTFGNTSTLLHFPTSMATDAYGNFWVLDNNNHRVQFYCRYPAGTTTGQTVAGGSLGSGPTNLRYPVGVTLDSALNIYVVDSSNYRIQKFQRLS